jgi:DNA-binding HxlR family transcriptional regulator
VEYSLTPMGVEVARQVEGLADWIEGNLGRILSGRRERADALATQPLPGVRAGVRTPA